MAEILNTFVDGVMTGTTKLAEDQTYEQLDAIVRLFNYFNDKDLFYEGFRRSLSKRLLTQKIKEDWERHFLTKVKISCGDAYTKKLEGMFNDVKISLDQINPNFKQWLENKNRALECQMVVTLLNENQWPPQNRITLNPAVDFTPPVKAFEEFFGCASQKKVLTWIYQSGDTDVHYSFVPPGSKPGTKPITVELNISCTQACVCLLFNQHPKLKLKEILDTLGTSEEHLKYSLTPLIYTQTRFIANKGPQGTGKKETKEDGTPAPVTWDSLDPMDYLAPCGIKQPKRRIQFAALKQLPPGDPNKNPNQRKPGDQNPEDPDLMKEVMRDREMKMQLALVRVMKMRNQLPLNALIAEATDQLSKYFIPETKIMRKQIEVLMERGFMKRDEDDHKIIHYVA